MQGNEENPQQPRRRGSMAALGAGAELVVYAVAGCWVGRWADGRFNTAPWLLLAGSLAGIVLGLYQFIRETAAPRR